MIDRDFKVGDKVTCNMFDLGEVIKISYNYVYVKFLSGVIESYLLDGKRFAHSKRTLFILPPIKPTKQQVKEKFKELLDKAEYVEFTYQDFNYYVVLRYGDNDKNCYCGIHYSFVNDECNFKYILKADAERIVKEMNKFINGQE